MVCILVPTYFLYPSIFSIFPSYYLHYVIQEKWYASPVEQAWTSVNKREKATNKEASERIAAAAHL